MIDSKDILTLLGLPSEDVSQVSVICDTSDIYQVEIELKDIRPSVCPYCSSDKIIIKDYYTTSLNNSIIRKKKLFVNIRIRRYKCKCCKKTFKQKTFLYDDNNSISKNVKKIVQKMLVDRVSMEYIAKELAISKTTVINILDAMPNPIRSKLPSVICLDEFHFSNANHKAGKYPCVISNPFSSEIVDIVESRRKDYLIEYFEKIAISERKQVKYFISDMNETYRLIHHKFFAHSTYIVDHFHIIKLFTDAIQKLRIKIMKEQHKDSKAYRYLKRNWKLFLKNRYSLKDQKFVNQKNGVVHYTLDSIDMVLKEYPELHALYWAKDEFCSCVVKLQTIEETTKTLDFYINQFTASTIKELNEIGRTSKNWYHEIIHAYSKNDYGVVLTNAMAESNNNYIQTLINIGYGYSNFNRLRKRILYMTSNKNSNQ